MTQVSSKEDRPISKDLIINEYTFIHIEIDIQLYMRLSDCLIKKVILKMYLLTKR